MNKVNILPEKLETFLKKEKKAFIIKSNNKNYFAFIVITSVILLFAVFEYFYDQDLDQNNVLFFIFIIGLIILFFYLTIYSRPAKAFYVVTQNGIVSFEKDNKIRYLYWNQILDYVILEKTLFKKNKLLFVSKVDEKAVIKNLEEEKKKKFSITFKTPEIDKKDIIYTSLVIQNIDNEDILKIEKFCREKIKENSNDQAQQ